MTDLTQQQAPPASGGASERAAGVAGATKDQAASVASTTADEVKNLASEAAAEAKNVVADARQQLRRQADEQSAKVASAIAGIGTQLHKMADAGDAGTTQQLVGGLADRADQVAQRLGDGGLDRTLDDARRIARNRPGLFLAGAALAGFVAARVVRLADQTSLKEAATGGSNGSAPEGIGQAGPTVASLPPTATPLSTPTGIGATEGL